MRSVIREKSATWRSTDSRQRALNAAIPKASMSLLLVKPSSFSTASSTGRPWQSQPARRGTWKPRIVRYRGNRSLKTRASTWWVPGLPLAVGGPS